MKAWVARRTRRALLDYREAARLASILTGPISRHADADKAQKARRMGRWAAVWRLLGRPDPDMGMPVRQNRSENDA